MWFMLLLNRPLGPEFTRSGEHRECEPQSIEQRPVKRFVPWSLRPLFVANFTGRCAFSELMSAKNNQTGSLEAYGGRGRGSDFGFSELRLSSAAIVNSNSLPF